LLGEEFKKLGVALPFVNRPIATSPEDQLLLQRQGVMAEYEREKILERYRRGKLHKAQHGHVSVLSGAPYGYGDIPATATEAARYEILDREALIVKRVFPLLVTAPQSIGAIARLLTTEQILRGERWEKGSAQWCGQGYAIRRIPDRLRIAKPQAWNVRVQPNKHGIRASLQNMSIRVVAIVRKKTGFGFPCPPSLVLLR
jgi:hypothetical protein